MINVSCESCGKKYKIDPAIIRADHARFTCKQCHHVNSLDSYIETKTAQSGAKTSLSSSQDEGGIAWQNRLQIKVTFVLVALIVIIMGTFIAFTYVSEKKNMAADLSESSVNVAKRLSVYLVEAFWSLDDEILMESLKAEMIDRNIYAINLIDRSGKRVYLGFVRDEKWLLKENDNPVLEKGLISSSEKIMRNGEKIGNVDVYFSPKFVQEGFVHSMYQLVATSFLLLVAIVLAAVLVLSRMVLSPIAKLTTVANRISVGELELDIPIESKDEIGRLAQSFARMKAGMTFAIKQLRQRK